MFVSTILIKTYILLYVYIHKITGKISTSNGSQKGTGQDHTDLAESN